MTRIIPFAKILFLVFTVILCLISECSSILSDKRLCYDPKCSEPVSLARTTLTYVAGEKGMVTVPISTIVTVYSKGAGKRPDLWGVEFNGNRGYIPKNFLKEYKILKKNLTYEVPTETVNNSKNNNDNNYNDISNLKDNENKPDTIQIYSSTSNTNIDASIPTAKEENTDQSINEIVIDGTTIPINNEESTKSNNASVIEATPLLNSIQTNDNVNADIKPTATQIELNVPTTPQQETEISNEEELKIVTYSDTSNINIEPNESIVESQLNEDDNNNTNSSNIESTEEEKKDTIDSFSSDMENEKEKNNIDSSKFVSENEQEKMNVSSVNVELENKESKHDTVSLTVKSEENVKTKDNLESSTSELEYKHDNKENVLSSIIESNSEEATQNKSAIEEEIKIENNSIENTNNIDNLFPQTESSKQVEVEDKTENVYNLETSNMDQSNNMVSTENSSDDSNVSENISNDKENVEQFVNEVVNIPKIDKDGEIMMEGNNQMEVQDSQNDIVNSDVNMDNVDENTSSFGDVPTELNTVFGDNNKQLHSEEPQSSQNDATDIIPEQIFHEFRNNRNLLLVEENVIPDKTESQIDDVQNNTDDSKTENLPKYEDISIEDKFLNEMEDKDKIEDEVLYNKDTEDLKKSEDVTLLTTTQNMHFSDVCTVDSECTNNGDTNYGFISQDKESVPENSIMRTIKVEHTYWVTLLYLSITAITTLVFSLGYYYIENMRRDGQLIAKINKLEKQLFISTKESLMLDEHLKSTKSELYSVQDKSFGSNEMVLSLKAELEASQKVNTELEEQIAMLEKDLESATEAGLELERMLREVLSSNNEVNPLTQSVEDLQARLNVQQDANESLTNALNVKTQENEALLVDLNIIKKKYEEQDNELKRITEEFKIELNKRNKIQENLNEIIQQLEVQTAQLSTDKANLYKELKIKEAEMKDLVEVINQVNSNNLDIEKLYEVSHVKAEASQLLEERNDLKIRLSEVEGAHSLLEEHMKLVKEEVSSLSEQCKVAEKEKRDAETRLEVISNFFKEKEAQRQKEEALWLQKQGEVTSTVERIQTMQNEIQGYKQQIEMLKREIVDQEREYKSQITILETKAHEQWVTARQNERRLEESKAEAGQLRNRLTLIEKNLSDADGDTKLHRRKRFSKVKQFWSTMERNTSK
ncbi:PREDICTED: transport and Golgi organization protein 1 isoform X2 [Polistes dominula]|uniref:Transport and Golgi organization protein 1 isoform X2 n=1 Tax=Polistes dominula TaxID=743375 RepID=A0ABM1J043_POLDO|nr:PREDICTED: transport and Golgi organization protein 1 isoform X2 [Polistes dominula]